MKKFHDPRAIECIKEAEKLEDFVASKEAELEKNNLPMPEYYLDILAGAAALRIQAEDIELGVEDA